ncbi:hypothetical protein BLNAU_21575 [Blattamonas nauphoetae]|uniref:Uncharacterized protein n=1 Tax=Blattamonas nauphoetae TaxID=2049346 RepID=A0ABQ9WVH7_9EUKA|nr:hypothetical protein BLNAU_21575 [Blattamonas nauphoetae]
MEFKIIDAKFAKYHLFSIITTDFSNDCLIDRQAPQRIAKQVHLQQAQSSLSTQTPSLPHSPSLKVSLRKTPWQVIHVRPSHHSPLVILPPLAKGNIHHQRPGTAFSSTVMTNPKKQQTPNNLPPKAVATTVQKGVETVHELRLDSSDLRLPRFSSKRTFTSKEDDSSLDQQWNGTRADWLGTAKKRRTIWIKVPMTRIELVPCLIFDFRFLHPLNPDLELTHQEILTIQGKLFSKTHETNPDHTVSKHKKKKFQCLHVNDDGRLCAFYKLCTEDEAGKHTHTNLDNQPTYPEMVNRMLKTPKTKISMQNDLQSGIDHAIQDLVACDGISLSMASGDRMRNVVVEAIKLGQKRSLARPESLYVHHSRKTITKAITERSNTLFSTQFSSPLYRLTSLAIDSGTTAHKSYNVFVVLNSQEDSPPLLYNLDQNRHTNEILAASIGSTIDTLSQLKTLVLSIVTDGYRGFSSGLCGLSRIRHLQNGAAQSMHLWRIFFRDALTTMLKPSQNYQFPSSHHPPITQTFIDLTEETRPTRRRCLQKMAIAVQRMYDDDETEDSEEWRVDPDYSQKKDVPRSRQYQESQTKIETEIIDVEDDGQSHHAQDHIGPAQYEETMQIDLDDTTIADDGITPAEN